MDTLLAFFGGSIAALLAKGLVGKLKVLLPEARDAAGKNIPRIIDSIEEKTGWDVPDGFEKSFNDTLHNIVLRSAAFAEGYIYNPAFWNKVFRALLSSKASNAKALMQQLIEWLRTVDWQTAVLDSLPADLRPVVNEVKEAEATKTAVSGVQLFVNASKASNMLPANASIAPTDEEMKPLVQDAARAIKLMPPLMDDFKAGGMTKKLADEISRRHEARMAEYKEG
jgi:hypothetical protein